MLILAMLFLRKTFDDSCYGIPTINFCWTTLCYSYGKLHVNFLAMLFLRRTSQRMRIWKIFRYSKFCTLPNRENISKFFNFQSTLFCNTSFSFIVKNEFNWVEPFMNFVLIFLFLANHTLRQIFVWFLSNWKEYVRSDTSSS